MQKTKYMTKLFIFHMQNIFFSQSREVKQCFLLLNYQKLMSAKSLIVVLLSDYI